MPVTLEEPASLPPPPSLSYILYMYSLTDPGRGARSLSQSVGQLFHRRKHRPALLQLLYAAAKRAAKRAARQLVGANVRPESIFPSYDARPFCVTYPDSCLTYTRAHKTARRTQRS